MSAGRVSARDCWTLDRLATLLCLREATVQSGPSDCGGDSSSALAKDGSISDVARISGTVEGGGGVEGIVRA